MKKKKSEKGKVRSSAAETANHIPFIPRKDGSRRSAPSRNTKVRRKEIVADTRAFPREVKKAEENILNPIKI